VKRTTTSRKKGGARTSVPAPITEPDMLEPGPLEASPPEMADLPAVAPSPAPAPAPAMQSNGNGAELLLYTKGLRKVYDGRAVVNGVDIEVRKGEIVGLLGPNGAGKTTSFYMIVGLVRPNGGSVFFNGKDTTDEPMYKRARLGMGYLPQEESIFRKLTVRENILAVMETQNFTSKERKAQCQQLMEKFGIEHVADNLALTLSGGEKRRLTIARSLVTEPKLIMLDEPFSGVDPIAVEDIQNIILMLRNAGLAILITDHNVRETLSIVDRAYLIHEGRVLLHGTREYLINHPLARENYLGENFNM
jgi:lipopolysaccharide export system ATP-binding protein